MNHLYQLTGMTCTNCEAKVTEKLLAVPGITAVQASKDKQQVELSMNQHIPTEMLQEALGGASSKYQISIPSVQNAIEENRSWLKTYAPILLIFSYISALSLLLSFHEGRFMLASFMTVFMSGFFLTFSFFKFLDLKNFVESYAMYDILAKKIKSWGYIYASIELMLGLAYAINFQPSFTSWIAFIVMSISIIGVLQSVWRKQQIQCACLGSVFKLPMSTVTIVEDALMIVMSAAMLLMH